MRVPGGGEPERRVDREPHEGGGEHPDARQRPEPDRDLHQSDRDTGENGRVAEDAHQWSGRRPGREAGELRPDVVAATGSEEVGIEELLRTCEDERDAEERPEDPDRPRHLDPALRDARRPVPPAPSRIRSSADRVRSEGGLRASRVGSHVPDIRRISFDSVRRTVRER